VYLPSSYYSNTDKRYPVSYHQDGQNLYKTVIGTVNVLDNLVFENKIEEIILVGIYSYIENRSEFYTRSKTEQYESFVMNQVLPYIESTYRVIDNPKSRNIGGVSAGGSIAAQIAYNHPSRFGLCMLMSPAWGNSVLDTIINGVRKDIKFYIDWGSYESGIKTSAKKFRDKMLAKNYELEWHEWHDAHAYGNFRAHQDNAYTFLFPSKNAAGMKHEINEISNGYILFQNYPNPFNPSTTLSFVIGQWSFVSLKVYDVLGIEVATIVNEEKPAGTYEITWNASNLPSGVYFYQLKAGSYAATKKLLLLK
jgi:predicted alpha/beta superfamily hydrolase